MTFTRVAASQSLIAIHCLVRYSVSLLSSSLIDSAEWIPLGIPILRDCMTIVFSRQLSTCHCRLYVTAPSSASSKYSYALSRGNLLVAGFPLVGPFESVGRRATIRHWSNGASFLAAAAADAMICDAAVGQRRDCEGRRGQRHIMSEARWLRDSSKGASTSPVPLSII